MRRTTTAIPRTDRTRPRPALKRFGQHFLEPAWVDKVMRAIAPTTADTFIEIGPGRGVLTRCLTASASGVVAFEIDRVLATSLRDEGLSGLTIVDGDFLEVTLDQIGSALPLPARPAPPGLPALTLRVAGNLPYNVASPILFKLIDLHGAGLPIADAIVMLQREVADRLLAGPGRKEYGTLTVLVGLRAKVEHLLALPPGAFRPAPKVQSSLVRLRFHAAEPPVRDEGIFRALVQAVFTRRRKTLSNALLAFEPTSRLRPTEALERADLDGRRRPETLDIAEFAKLADVFCQGSDGGLTPV